MTQYFGLINWYLCIPWKTVPKSRKASIELLIVVIVSDGIAAMNSSWSVWTTVGSRVLKTVTRASVLKLPSASIKLLISIPSMMLTRALHRVFTRYTWVQKWNTPKSDDFRRTAAVISLRPSFLWLWIPSLDCPLSWERY